MIEFWLIFTFQYDSQAEATLKNMDFDYPSWGKNFDHTT